MNGDRLPKLRLDMRRNDMLFNDFLQITDKNLKWQFITQNIWILHHENYMQQLRDQFRQSRNSHSHTHMPEISNTIMVLGVVVLILLVVVLAR